VLRLPLSRRCRETRNGAHQQQQQLLLLLYKTTNTLLLKISNIKTKILHAKNGQVGVRVGLVRRTQKLTVVAYAVF
jgi:hypothetical protein